jgi:hypothetical protein
MSGTVEITNKNIWNKIKSICDLLSFIDTFLTQGKENNLSNKEILNYTKLLSEYKKSIDLIKGTYEMGSIIILSNYFLVSNNYKNANKLDKKIWDSKKNTQFINYQTFIIENNFIANLNRLINNIKTHITQKIKFPDDSINTIKKIYSIFNNSTVGKKIKLVTYTTCVCKTNMNIDSAISALVCKKCGMTKDLNGTVFEDDQFYYQEGCRTKHGTYDPSKHCRFWVERIQARESTNIPQKIIDSIYTYIKRDNIKNKNKVTCALIRKYLQLSGNSSYNEHVPLIRKLITGITPPQLTEYEMQLIHIYFDKVVRILDDIKSKGKPNCPYHPYFIYKIVGQILTKPMDRIRKQKILECIHLQSRDTLIENDKLWFLVCEKLQMLKYEPTDRNKQYKSR